MKRRIIAICVVVIALGLVAAQRTIPERRPEIEVNRVELEDGRYMHCAAITWFSQVGIDCNWDYFDKEAGG